MHTWLIGTREIRTLIAVWVAGSNYRNDFVRVYEAEIKSTNRNTFQSQLSSINTW